MRLRDRARRYEHRKARLTRRQFHHGRARARRRMRVRLSRRVPTSTEVSRMTPQHPLGPEEFGRLAARMVCDAASEQLRTDPEVIAGVLGLTYAGSWARAHHFTAPAEGLAGVRYERATSESPNGS